VAGRPPRGRPEADFVIALDRWDRAAYLLIAATAVYAVVMASGWHPLGDSWPWFALAGLAFMLAWSVRTLRDLRAMERAAKARHAEFDAKLRKMGGER
jgi:hypothetical protein